MTGNVPTTDSGSARLGISVAQALRRKRKITTTTSPSVRRSVRFTSLTAWSMPTDRSKSVWMRTPLGIWVFIESSSARTALATLTVLVPG